MPANATIMAKILADNTQLSRDLADAQRKIKGFERAAERSKKKTKNAFAPLAQSAQNVGGPLSKVVGGLGLAQGALQNLKSPAGVAAAAVAGVAMAFKFVGDGIDKLKSLAAQTKVLARETGMSMESSSAWIGVAGRMGVSSSQLSTSFGLLSKRIQAAQTGTKAADKQLQTFAQAGVSPAVLASRNMDRILMAVSDRFKKMPDGVGKSDLAMKLFGRSGKSLLPILNQGRDGIKNLKGEMGALGKTINEKTVGDVTRLTKAQKRLKDVWDGIQIILATKVIPYLADFAKNLSDAIVEVREGKKPTSTLARYLTSIAHALERIRDAYRFVRPVFRALARIDVKRLTGVGRFFSDLKGLGKSLGIPGFAQGGVVTRPTLAVVGEAGPEAIVPLSRPARKSSVMREAGLAGGETVFNIFNYGNQLDERQLAAKIGWQLAVRGVS